MTTHHNAVFVTIDQPSSLATIVREFLHYKVTLDRPIEVAIAGLFLVVAAFAGSVAAGTM